MPRSFPLAAPLAALSILVAGCSNDEAHLKELARYTPEILAKELLTVYKTSIQGASAARASAKGSAGPSDDKEREAAKRYGPEFAPRDASQTEKSESISLDELAASAAKKAKLVEGQTPQQVLAKVVDVIESETSLPSADKEKLTAALKAAFGS